MTQSATWGACVYGPHKHVLTAAPALGHKQNQHALHPVAAQSREHAPRSSRARGQLWGCATQS